MSPPGARRGRRHLRLGWPPSDTPLSSHMRRRGSFACGRTHRSPLTALASGRNALKRGTTGRLGSSSLADHLGAIFCAARRARSLASSRGWWWWWGGRFTNPLLPPRPSPPSTGAGLRAPSSSSNPRARLGLGTRAAARAVSPRSICSVPCWKQETTHQKPARLYCFPRLWGAPPPRPF